MAMNPNVPNEITRQLDNVNFPASKDDILSKVGTQSVNVGGKNLNMRDILNKVQKDRFNSKDELITALGNVPDIQGGQQKSGGQTGGNVGGGQQQQKTGGGQTGGNVGGGQSQMGGTSGGQSGGVNKQQR